MAEWWLLDKPTQDGIAEYLDDASNRVLAHFDSHGDENSLTAALCQELIRKPFAYKNTTVVFDYRNFSEQAEEPLLGADGGILITITTPEERVEKAVLFQAKRLPQRRQPRSLTIRKTEASRLKKQVKTMMKVSEDSIVINHTRRGIYAVDAEALEDLTVENLRHPLETPRLLGIGTFLGKWVSRCSRGDLSDSVKRIILTPRGLLRHQLIMDIETKQRPLLTDGGSPITNDGLLPHQMPTPRWRMPH